MKKIISFLIAALSALVPFAQPESEEIKLPVIMYHHISEKGSLLNEYVITPEEFESDIAYLKDHGYHSVLPSQIESGNIPENPVMITFDDGFLSNYKYALPILEKYSMTAVCAVIGSLVKEYTENPNTVSDCAYMDTDTVKKMAESGIFEIACHTYNMHSTSGRKGCAKMKEESDAEYRAALTQDLTKFNELYETTMGASTDIIAFPYGAYSKDTVHIASDAGYKIFLTCEEKVNAISTHNDYPLVLGRYNRPHGISSESFFDKMDI